MQLKMTENDNGLEILSAHQNEDLMETVKLSNNVINEAANVEESEVHNQKVHINVAF